MQEAHGIKYAYSMLHLLSKSNCGTVYYLSFAVKIFTFSTDYFATANVFGKFL